MIHCAEGGAHVSTSGETSVINQEPPLARGKIGSNAGNEMQFLVARPGKPGLVLKGGYQRK